MRFTISLLLALAFLVGTLSAQISVPRLSIQYGDSKCYTNRLAVNNSLPDLGLHLTIEVISFGKPYTGSAVAWLGRNRINIPWRVSTGQTCYFLAFPDIQFVVQMYYGYGSMIIFKIPDHPSLVGLRLYAQAAIIDGTSEVWSRGTEMVIQ